MSKQEKKVVKGTNASKPSKEVLDKWAKMTDDYEHGRVYDLVSFWAMCYSATPEDFAEFAMFNTMLKAIEDYANKVENCPYWEMRHNIGKLLDAAIERVYGTETLQLINSAR